MKYLISVLNRKPPLPSNPETYLDQSILCSTSAQLSVYSQLQNQFWHSSTFVNHLDGQKIYKRLFKTFHFTGSDVSSMPCFRHLN